MKALLHDYAGLMGTRSESEWCEALFAHSREMGFERTMFAVVPRLGLPLDDAFLRTTYTGSWRTLYDERNMIRIDPTVSHCLSKSSPLLWSPQLFASAAQRQMYEEARSFGLRTGLTLPIHGPNGEVGMVCFVTDRSPSRGTIGDLARELPRLTLLRDVAFESCQPYLASHARTKLPRLTPRECECLRWTAIGKSSWDIAQLLRCSEAVVNFHLANVRRKLCVSSRRAAAVKAVCLGLIVP